MKKSLLALICVFGALAGCSDNTKADPYMGDNAQYIYAKGHTYLQKASYTNAITAYQSLDAQYPFQAESQKGDLEIIYAYYQNDSPALALTSANRYLKLYPNSPDAAYAYYMMGVVNFENGRGFLQRYTPYDMTQHNAQNYITAFNNLNQVVAQYPNSPYSYDARRRMVYLYNTLAQFEMNAANLYYQQKAYVAALNRAQNVVLYYPHSPVVQNALEMMLNSYQQLGLNNLAASSKQVLATNFPHDPLLKTK